MTRLDGDILLRIRSCEDRRSDAGCQRRHQVKKAKKALPANVYNCLLYKHVWLWFNCGSFLRQSDTGHQKASIANIVFLDWGVR